MRKIENIQLVKVPARPPFAAAFYHVPGPEEINRKFTNFKKARAFVAELEKNLNIAAIELNNICLEVYGLFRRLYFYWRPVDLRLLENNFKTFDFSFNRLFYVGSNYNYFVFTHIENCQKALRACLQLISSEAVRRGNYILKNEAEAAALRLGRVLFFFEVNNKLGGDCNQGASA